MKKESEQKQKKKKGALHDVVGLVIALLIALGIRSFMFEPYNIPSGSMFPTLLVGDYLFITKHDYGYSRHSFPFSLPIIPKGRLFGSQPQQGDVVIFRMTPQINPQLSMNIDYIKRVIGLPGDTVQMKDGRLYINDIMVEREFVGQEKMNTEQGEITYNKYIETLPNGLKHPIYEINDGLQADNTQKFVIPEGYFFAMGDNRDNSLDSRFFGPVPQVNLEGKARFIFYSTTGDGWFFQFWRWGEFIRKERLFTGIK